MFLFPSWEFGLAGLATSRGDQHRAAGFAVRNYGGVVNGDDKPGVGVDDDLMVRGLPKGLRLLGHRVVPSGNQGGGFLSFFSTQAIESMVPGSMAAAASGGFTLEFRVTDVDARHEHLLARAVEILKPPTTQPWGRRPVWLRDPDGNIVNLYQEA